MLNLLIISNSSRMYHIKSTLQSVLRAIVDVAEDFDHGLKDVFEKRPTVIFIQDQIDGVTGESVASHIQMLLGDSAPRFLLLHGGSGKFKAIRGLYEQLVDLSASDEAVIEEMLEALKQTLGTSWDKIYMPSEVIIVSPLPESEISQDKEPARIVSSSDEMVELFLDEVRKAVRADAGAGADATDTDVAVKDSSVASKMPDSLFRTEATINATINTEAPAPSPIFASPVSSLTKVSLQKDSTSPSSTASPPATEFRISRKVDSDEEHIPEDLLLAFEQNYRSKFRITGYIVVLVCMFVLAGGWYLVSRSSLTLSFLRNSISSPTASRQAEPAVPPTGEIKKPVVAKAQAPPVVQELPSFIPQDRADASYSKKNPGWERYVGKDTEFRLFRNAGRIQAVQVIALKNGVVSESLIRRVLKEYAGSHQYQVTSSGMKSGVHIENGRVNNAADIKIYRHKSVVRALVVSVS